MHHTKGMTVAKVLVTLSILAGMVWYFDWRTIFRQIADFDLPFFMLAVAIFLLQVACQVLRLRLIVLADDCHLGWLPLARLTFASHAVNQVVPSVAGGDALRMVLVHRGGVPIMNAIRQVTIDRMTGLIGLIATVLGAWPFVPMALHDTLSPGRIWTVVMTVLGALGAALLLSRLAARRHRRTGLVARMGSLVEQLWRGLERLSRRPVLLLAVLAISVVNQLLYVLGFWVVAAGFPLAVDFAVAAFLLPVTTLVMMLPFSIAGWGVREAVLAVGLGLVGVPGDAAVASSVVFGLSTTLVGILSLPLLVHVWNRPDVRPALDAAELR